MIKRIIFCLTILTSIIACSEEVQKPIDPGSPPEFPHVFMGNAYVNGDPIKQGITIYAKFGESY